MAWIDHNLGGNALNRSSAAPIINAARPALTAGARIATAAPDANPIIGGADLIGTGLNVGKHLLGRVAPAVNSIPDYRTTPEVLRSVTGTPGISPDAPVLQKILENTAAMSANPRNIVSAFPRAVGSEVGQEVGERVGGEPGAFAGALVGGAPGDISGNLALRLAKLSLGGKQAQTVAEAGTRQGIQPTAGMVMNPPGRWFEKAIGSVPLIGGPVKAAQERASSQIADIQRQIAEQVYGGPISDQPTDTSIGEDLLAGARQGQANITQRAGEEFNRWKNDVGPNQPTNIRGVYRPAAQARFTEDPATYAPLHARLANLVRMAVEAQQPSFQAVSGPMPAGYAPLQRVMSARSGIGAAIPDVADLSGGLKKDLYGRLTDAIRAAAVAKDPMLGPAFDTANEHYATMMSQREALEKVGGQPEGGYGQFSGPGGVTQPTAGADFTGGKQGEGQAYNWLTDNLRSPSKLAPFADPTVVPNEYWRSVAGQWLARLGQTKEGTYRPEWMARDWSGPGTGVDPAVQTQLFTTSSGQPGPGISDMNDLATMGRNTVVPVERAGLSNTAGSVLAMKWILDRMKDAGGPLAMLAGGRSLASGMESPTFVNAMSGRITPLTDALYAGVPAATQTILQRQSEDPLGWGLTSSSGASNQ